MLFTSLFVLPRCATLPPSWHRRARRPVRRRRPYSWRQGILSRSSHRLARKWRTHTDTCKKRLPTSATVWRSPNSKQSPIRAGWQPSAVRNIQCPVPVDANRLVGRRCTTNVRPRPPSTRLRLGRTPPCSSLTTSALDNNAHVLGGAHHRVHRRLDLVGVEVGKLDLRDLLDLRAQKNGKATAKLKTSGKRG